MSSGIVTFDYSAWILRYPEFATVSSALAQQYFNEATMYCDNTTCSPVQDVTARAVLLNMMTAHISALNAPSNGQAASPLVGRIASAGEGSVNVSVELEGQIHGRAWFAQTKYGLAFWQATAQYRTAHYVPGKRRVTDPWARFVKRGMGYY